MRGLVRAWKKPYFQRRYAPERVDETLRTLRTGATFVAPVGTVHGIGEDEEDDLVLATAVAGDADVLVTGDKHLLGLGHYQNVAILSPREFLDFLDREQ